MTAAQEAAYIADRIQRNRAKAPSTVKLADFLWTLRLDSRKLGSVEKTIALETIAIQVDGWAQDGSEVNHETTLEVLGAVKALIEAE